jgi:feruloyl esterase
MNRRRLAAALLVSYPMLVSAQPPRVGVRAACENLSALTIPSVTIDAATLVAAGPFTPPNSTAPNATAPNAPAAMTLPAFCRVEATARPTSDSQIRFEVWIPPADAWNGRFEGVGNGGYQGSISYAALATALRRGYAAASTDTGHTGDDMKFGQGRPEKLVDYGWRAVHVMTDTAKLIVRNAQGRFPDKSYFVGCSAGGHQAMSEVQRFPADYDGVIAGAPANNRLRQTFGFMWSWTATHAADGAPLLTAAKLGLVTKAVIAACDADDGLTDGLVEDPRACRFDPATLACRTDADEAACLTAPQVGAVRKMYAGAKNPRTGEQIFTGWPRGSEYFGEAGIQSWRQYLTEPKEPSRIGLFRYFLFHDPGWDVRSLDYDRDLAYAERTLPHMAAVERDLSPFMKRGGKLLMYSGWMDPAVPPQDTVAYYEAVAKAMGGDANIRAFVRLFMAPGMGHCGGGPGPNQFDALTALEQWVEKGVAPATLPATHSTNGTVDRTRPLCPWPQVARYKGAGSIDDAANFACVSRPIARRDKPSSR